MEQKSSWWKGAVVYQIYPRSFCDSNNDGVGDLNGVTSRLDYVAGLGVDAIWLSPFFKSPMQDFGYDVSDYRAVDELFGSLDDFKALVERAHELGLRVIIDQVLSHSSDKHAWFEESRQSRDNEKADWYVWADANEDGTPPNNWLAFFGGPSWTWDPRRHQYYLHNFLESQPDLNFHNAEVRKAQLENMRFWLDIGVDGFRLDVVNFFFHSQSLQDNPAVPEGMAKMNGASADSPYSFQQHIFDISQPENLEYLRDIRNLLDEYPQTTSVGEISSGEPITVMADYTSGNDKLHMAYTFDLLTEKCEADWIRHVIQTTESKIRDGWPCWAVSNHDVARVASRWGQKEDPQLFPRVALAMMLSMRGSACLYQGDELAFPEADVPLEKIVDPYGLPFWPVYKGRDGCRTPMVWESEPKGGFSKEEGWLPVDKSHLPLAAAIQAADDSSMLNFMKSFLMWRKNQPALLRGDMEILEKTGEMLCWIRKCPEQKILVAINLSAETLRSPVPSTIKAIHQETGFGGGIEQGTIVLGPYQALFASIE